MCSRLHPTSLMWPSSPTPTSAGQQRLVAYVVPKPAPQQYVVAPEFSLFYFAADEAVAETNKYELYLEGAESSPTNMGSPQCGRPSVTSTRWPGSTPTLGVERRARDDHQAGRAAGRQRGVAAPSPATCG